VVLGGWLDLMILKVFSNLHDSMILCFNPASQRTSNHPGGSSEGAGLWSLGLVLSHMDEGVGEMKVSCMVSVVHVAALKQSLPLGLHLPSSCTGVRAC